MADPEIVDPELQARVVRTFNLRGDLAPFRLTEQVVPVFDIGRITGLTPTEVTTLAGSQGIRVGTAGATQNLTTGPVRYNDGDITNSGPVVNPAAAQVIADTGQLTAAHHIIHWLLNIDVGGDLHVEWRNAANAATLATWPYFIAGGGNASMFQPFIVNIALNERIRVITPAAVVGTVNATVAASAVITSFADL